MRRISISAAFALCLGLGATGAQAAAQPCVTSDEASVLMLVLAPEAIRAAGTLCARTLPSTALLRQAEQPVARQISGGGGRRLAAGEVGDRQDWRPRRNRAGRFGSDAPPADRHGPAAITGELKPKDCAAVDHIVTLLAPLPPRNAAELVVAFMQLGDDRRGKQEREAGFPDLPFGAAVSMDTILPPELVEAARRVVAENTAAGRRVTVAESCTGGLVAAAITEIPGSSTMFEAGYVTYSNDAKLDMLRVSADVIETFGAVSVATAWSMAQGALEVSGADVAVAITGVAGPGGGTEKKPVGTVVFARAERGADPGHVVADRRDFGDLGRGGIRLQAALVRARAPVAGDIRTGIRGRTVKHGGALFERADHPAQRGAEDLPGEHFEHPVLEGEIDAEIDQAAIAVGTERPVVAQISERAVEIIDMDAGSGRSLSTFDVKVSRRPLKPTIMSATISVSLSDRMRMALTQGRNSA